jgi:hypothetical protein
MELAIRFFLSNFTLTFLVLGFVAALVSLSLSRGWERREEVMEALLSYFLLFSIGLSFFYNFVMHVFFGEMSARFIGWEDSPFQTEVGFASLGFAIVGLLAFRAGAEMRLAAIVGPTFFLWGAAGGHAVEMIQAHNFAPGNAGVIFYTDIFVPLLGFLFIWLRYGSLKPARAW